MSKLYIYLTGNRPGYSYSNTYKSMVDNRDFTLEITDALDVSKLLHDKKYRTHCDRQFLIDNFECYNVTDKNLDDFINLVTKLREEKGYAEGEEYLDYINEISTNDFEEIYMRVPVDTAKNILDLNPKLKESKIYLSELYNEDELDKISSLIEMFNGITDRVYIQLKGNRYYTSLDSAKKTIDIIHNIAEEIKSLNLSPLEQIMYAYDIAKNRIYNEEKEDEEKSKSRDLTQVLFGENIVCVGFVAFFNAILKNLGFDPQYISLTDTEDQETGHRRSGVYVIDPKYYVDGFYYYDPTFDSRKIDDTDEEAINRYRCFALTKTQMDFVDNGKLKENAIPFYSVEFLSNFEKASCTDDFDFYRDFVISASTIVKYTNSNKIKPQTSDLNFELLVESVDKMNRPLSPMLLAEVLKEVRNKQHEKNPELYPKCDIAGKKTNLFLRTRTGSLQNDLLLTIFGEKEIYKNEHKAIKRIRNKFEERKRES